MKQRAKPKQAVLPDLKNKNNFLSTIINPCILITFFCLCFLLYKNISYPLLFNDEAETVMTGQQIIKYGYPKVHDEKNMVFIPDNPQWLGYKKSIDANVSIPWGNYYFATIGVGLAKFSDDIYRKTALVRIPFATAGLIGLLIFVFAFRDYFENANHFKIFLLVFLFLELFSVNLFLHLREARYYSLVVFSSALYFFILVNRLGLKALSEKKYVFLMSVVLFLSYQMNFITYVVMCLTLILYGTYSFLRNKVPIADRIKRTLYTIIPVGISAILVFPFLLYFETFDIAKKASEHYKFTADLFWKHITDITNALFKHEIFYSLIILLMVLIGFYFFIRKNKNKGTPFEARLENVLVLMSIFFVLYIIMVARIPFVWMRYFVVLQPLMVILILISAFLLFEYIRNSISSQNQKRYNSVFFVVLVLIGWYGFNKKEGHLGDYYYQLTHQYKGPLDEYIPYIMTKYSETDTLVLATNYEELSYMYYLNCKVILGYNYGFRTLTEDSLKRYDPDILIFRKKWGQDPRAYNYYIQQGKFERTSFPTVDWPVNNIADLEFFVKHQFKTLTTNDEKEKADIFLKVKK